VTLQKKFDESQARGPGAVISATFFAIMTYSQLTLSRL
jgi:hypothetical protein